MDKLKYAILEIADIYERIREIQRTEDGEGPYTGAANSGDEEVQALYKQAEKLASEADLNFDDGFGYGGESRPCTRLYRTNDKMADLAYSNGWLSSSC